MAQFLADTYPGIDNLPAFLKEWDADYLEEATQHTQKFMRFATDLIFAKMAAANVDPETSAKHIRDLIAVVQWCRDHIPGIKYQNFV